MNTKQQTIEHFRKMVKLLKIQQVKQIIEDQHPLPSEVLEVLESQTLEQRSRPDMPMMLRLQAT